MALESNTMGFGDSFTNAVTAGLQVVSVLSILLSVLVLRTQGSYPPSNSNLDFFNFGDDIPSYDVSGLPLFLQVPPFPAIEYFPACFPQMLPEIPPTYETSIFRPQAATATPQSAVRICPPFFVNFTGLREPGFIAFRDSP